MKTEPIASRKRMKLAMRGVRFQKRQLANIRVNIFYINCGLPETVRVSTEHRRMMAVTWEKLG